MVILNDSFLLLASFILAYLGGAFISGNVNSLYQNNYELRKMGILGFNFCIISLITIMMALFSIFENLDIELIKTERIGDIPRAFVGIVSWAILIYVGIQRKLKNIFYMIMIRIIVVFLFNWMVTLDYRLAQDDLLLLIGLCIWIMVEIFTFKRNRPLKF